MAGKVTFVGAGCGDPRLLTVRATEILAQADYVLFDNEVHPDVLGRLREGTPRHPVNAIPPERTAAMLVDEAKKGHHAVRLAWADPLLFGHGDAEALVVARAGIALEIVPGVSAFTAVGAFASTPLTRSGDASPSVGVVSVTRGHESLHDWDKLTSATDTLAILCDAESVAEAARSLTFYGRSPTERVTMVENVSLPSQRVVETTLGEIPLLPRSRAARVVVIVGERAARVRDLDWFMKKPLFGKRVLVTRAREQAASAATLLRERGADPVVVPTIEIHPPSDPGPMIDAANTLASRYGWVVFTSSNGVERFVAEVRRQGRDARAFANAKIAAVGPGTAAALERAGLSADLVPKDFHGDALAVALKGALGDAKPHVLVARAEVARDVVPDTLRALGCTVDVVPVYKTKAPPRPLLEALASLLEGREIDAVTFTSSSTVEHLCDALESRAAALLAQTCVASIGPITTETAKKRGIRVDTVATESTILGLVNALEAHFTQGLSKPSS